MNNLPIKATKVFYKNRDSKAQIVINRGGSRSSKCLAKGTEVVMFDGSLKKVEAVKIGDKVMGIDSSPRTVTELHNGIGNLYLISQNKGIDYIVEEDHLLQLKRSTGAKNSLKKYSKGKIYTKKVPGRYHQYGDEISIKAKDFYNKSKRFKCNFYGYRVPINFSEKSLDIDPYFLGLWLGDGHKHKLSITTMDSEIVDYVYNYADKISAAIRVDSKSKESKAKVYNIIEGCAFELRGAFLSLLPDIKNKIYSLSRAARELGVYRSTLKRWVIETENGTFDISSRSNVSQNKFKTKLASLFNKYNLFNNKHIPSDFLYNSRENRLLLLAGLLDTDGCLGKCGGFVITQKNENLAKQIHYLASSLGFRCSIKSQISTIKSINFSGIYFSVSIYGEIENIPTRIQRKKFIRKTKFFRNQYVSGIQVTPHGIGEYYGFSLDGDGLFLLKDFTVVHNSFSISQLLFLERFFTQKNKKVLVLRKTLPSLRLSVYQDFKNFVNMYNLESIIEENKQFLDYYYRPNNNYLHFGSLDNPEKIKSSSWNFIWMNEATDFDEDDFLQLLLRLSEPTIDGQRNQLFMCLNPIDEFHWIKTKVLDKREIYDLEEIHSTYKDNPFLSEDYKKLVESYLHIDFNKYKVYALGEWGKLENLIYTNWDTTTEYVNNGEIIYGLDFGFTNPSALLKLVINDKDIFEEEVIYQTELTNSQLIEKCGELGVSKTFPIYADNAEPDRIQEFREAGYNVIGCVKDVLNSIDFVKRFKIHCYKPSINLIKEKMGYSRRKDKNGRLYEEPAPNIADHIMNCEQYAIFTHLRHRYFEVKVRFI